MSSYLKERIVAVLAEAYADIRGTEPQLEYLEIRASDRSDFGDYSSNIALLDAAARGERPREVAQSIADALSDRADRCGIERVDVAGPGFINVFLSADLIHEALQHILAESETFGRSSYGAGKRIQVEFVSSNPTGPLTVGHGRQAVLGDVLATLYALVGYDVHREYYFNDEGRQVDLLAKSLWVRYREAFGESHEIPEDGYRGEYLTALGSALQQEVGDKYPVFDEQAKAALRAIAVERMTNSIKSDLATLGVAFDTWFSEATLHERGEVDAALETLREAGGVYEEDGAVWLRSEANGGEKDSVLVRSDGRSTYLLVDIAYHIDKRQRGFDRVLNVQGADHHTEQSCMKAALHLLGYPDGWLSYAVHQFVSLKEGGETLKMSTRAGRFVTLHDLIDELGKDIVRYFMISRKPEAHLDFDLDLARSQSIDNPATYIQYAHTRIASIFAKADEADLPEEASDVDLSPLVEPEELDLIKTLDRFPNVIENAALSFAPHLVAENALQLSRTLHSYYDKHRVLSDDRSLTTARLALLRGIAVVLRRSLAVLGMDAPEAM